MYSIQVVKKTFSDWSPSIARRFRAYSFCAVFLFRFINRNGNRRVQKEQFSSERNNFHGNKMAHSLISNRKGKKCEKIIRERSSKNTGGYFDKILVFADRVILSSSFFLDSPRTCLHGYHQEMESCCCFEKRPFRRESGEKDVEHLKKRKSFLCFP